jgi:hypothetical protein
MNGWDKCSRFKLSIDGLEGCAWPKGMGLIPLGTSKIAKWCRWDKVQFLHNSKWELVCWLEGESNNGVRGMEINASGGKVQLL